MKRYTVKLTDDFEKAEIGRITESPWDYVKPPRTEFRAIRGEDALKIQLKCYEEDPVARIDRRHGPVCNDSCMEFFFSPCSDCSLGYFNFEVNSNPTYLFDYGPDAGDGRFHIDADEELNVKAERGEDETGKYWQIAASFPFEFIKRYEPGADFSHGAVIRANVYKCGKTEQPEHYASWSPVGTPGPNFHMPEFFGEFVLE